MNAISSFTEEEINLLIYFLEKVNNLNEELNIKKNNLIQKFRQQPTYVKYTGILAPVKLKGYHIDDIPRGEYGELSKVIEETLELKDAMEQGQKLMCLIELSDIIGAIEGYLEKHYAGKVTFTDLENMSNATKRAFESGQRK